MLKKRIVPCLDVKGGRVVKGVKFRDLRDAGDPAELAARYEAEGGDEIVFLDIGASVEARKTTLDTVRRTAEQLFIPLTVGGGVRSGDDVQEALSAGADKVSLNTAAVLHPEIITPASDRFGAQCIVVAIDAKRVGEVVPARGDEGGSAARSVGVDAESAVAGGWEVFTHGGSKPTGLDVVEWARKVEELGAGEILLTSMDRDGTRDGYDIPLLKAVTSAVGVPVIASGGAGNAEHLFEALTAGKADAALAASIFHDRETTVREVKSVLHEKGVQVRL